MESYKTFLHRLSGYNPMSEKTVSIANAENACRMAQKEALDKVASELQNILKRDNEWVHLPEVIKSINAIRDSIQK